MNVLTMYRYICLTFEAFGNNNTFMTTYIRLYNFLVGVTESDTMRKYFIAKGLR